MVKSGRANSNADYMSRQRGPEASSSIETSIPDEFPDDAFVFHLFGEEPSAYEDVIRYLTEKAHPAGLSRGEKMIFQTKVAPIHLDKGNAFPVGAG